MCGGRERKCHRSFVVKRTGLQTVCAAATNSVPQENENYLCIFLFVTSIQSAILNNCLTIVYMFSLNGHFVTLCYYI